MHKNGVPSQKAIWRNKTVSAILLFLQKLFRPETVRGLLTSQKWQRGLSSQLGNIAGYCGQGWDRHLQAEKWWTMAGPDAFCHIIGKESLRREDTETSQYLIPPLSNQLRKLDPWRSMRVTSRHKLQTRCVLREPTVLNSLDGQLPGPQWEETAWLLELSDGSTEETVWGNDITTRWSLKNSEKNSSNSY